MRRQRGLTLVELMVTLAVAIILLAVALPMYRSITANNRVAGQTNALVSALQLARSEAVTRLASVAVCARSNDTTCGTSANWANGWLVFVDADEDGVLDAGEERVKIFAALRGNPALTPDTNAVAVIQYQSGGDVVQSEDFQLQQAGSTGDSTRCIRVSLTGQVRTERNACS